MNMMVLFNTPKSGNPCDELRTLPDELALFPQFMAIEHAIFIFTFASICLFILLWHFMKALKVKFQTLDPDEKKENKKPEGADTPGVRAGTQKLGKHILSALHFQTCVVNLGGTILIMCALRADTVPMSLLVVGSAV